MGKLIFVLIAAFLIASAYAAGDCPAASKVNSCSPKCIHDTECSAIGGKCCRNVCNYSSCVQPNLLLNSGSSGYKGSGSSSSSGGGAGNFCGNTKCSPYEKCQQDRATNRPKCVRT